jgi:hypothetical protein
MILKFLNKDGQLVLDSKKGEMIDITADNRTRLLDKKEMTKDKYKVSDNIYFLKKDLFVIMAKKQNRDTIEALLIKYNDKQIIIVGNGSYTFYEGYSVNVQDYGATIDKEKATQVASCS